MYHNTAVFLLQSSNPLIYTCMYNMKTVDDRVGENLEGLRHSRSRADEHNAATWGKLNVSLYMLRVDCCIYLSFHEHTVYISICE